MAHVGVGSHGPHPAVALHLPRRAAEGLVRVGARVRVRVRVRAGVR